MLTRTISLKLNMKKRHSEAVPKFLHILCNFYNYCLDQRIVEYKNNKKTLSAFEQQKQIKNVRDNFDPEHLVHTHLLQDATKRLDLSFKSFFRRLKENKSGKSRKAPGFPRFKNINRYRSFTFKEHTNGYKIITKDDFISKIKITNLGSISVFNKFKLPKNAKFLIGTLHSRADGYYFNLTYSYDEEQKPLAFVRKNKPLFPYSSITHRHSRFNQVGVDVGMRDFITTSDGDKINCVNLESEFIKLKELNKHRRHKRNVLKKLGLDVNSSRRFCNLQSKIAKQHRKIFNIRQDFQRKLANWLTANYQTIYIEKLNIGSLIRNSFSRNHTRKIHQAGWSSFSSKLEHKAENAGVDVQKVPSFWTSQICCFCFEPSPKETDETTHICENCGLIEDRDINAAKNIKIIGIKPDALSVPKARLNAMAKPSQIQDEAPASIASQ